jgi:hypothetical protein
MMKRKNGSKIQFRVTFLPKKRRKHENKLKKWKIKTSDKRNMP